MKKVNKSLIAAGVAAALSISSSVFAADTAGSTITSKTYSVSVVFDSKCMVESFNALSQSYWQGSWWGYMVESYGSVTGNGSVLDTLQTVVKADIAFDITKHGLQGATSQVDLTANISNMNVLFGQVGSETASENLYGAGVWWQGPVASGIAGARITTTAGMYEQNATSVAVSTSVKGANITEFSSQISVDEISTKVMNELVVYDAFMAASSSVGWAEGYVYATDFAAAFTDFMNTTSVDLRVNAHYQNTPGVSGDDASIVVIDNVEAKMMCGAGANVWSDTYVITNGNGDVFIAL